MCCAGHPSPCMCASTHSLLPSATVAPGTTVQTSGLERTLLRHQATTWELLHVLFCAIEGEAAGRAQQGGEDGEDGMEGEQLWR